MAKRVPKHSDAHQPKTATAVVKVASVTPRPGQVGGAGSEGDLFRALFDDTGLSSPSATGSGRRRTFFTPLLDRMARDRMKRMMAENIAAMGRQLVRGPSGPKLRPRSAVTMPTPGDYFLRDFFGRERDRDRTASARERSTSAKGGQARRDDARLREDVDRLIRRQGMSDRGMVEYFRRLKEAKGAPGGRPPSRDRVRRAREDLGYTPAQVRAFRDGL